MNTIDNIKERYQQQSSLNGNNVLSHLGAQAFDNFNRLGVPTARHEEWKYTRIGNVFNKELIAAPAGSITAADLAAVRLPGYESANELVFVNGLFNASLSNIQSPSLAVLSLNDAAQNEYADIVAAHLGHSDKYLKDGVHALNTAFVKEGVFVAVKKGKVTEHPIYIYNIIDARSQHVFSQPRMLIYVAENAQVQIVEDYRTLGVSDSLTNQVMEIIVEKAAVVEYCKIQNDIATSNLVSTTHFRQIGKSVVHAVTVSLNGGIVRNNLNIAMEADYCESNMSGLYFIKGETHVDNHTVVDNVRPNCLSNELYKGVVDDRATAVFNGKIFVEPQAQKTNAFQSNKNIVLSDNASVNTKPQLEIYADDVKCSHGCTVGQLDEEGLFYLQSRGIDKDSARALLVQAFAIDILEHIQFEPIRKYVDQLISERLEFKL